LMPFSESCLSIDNEMPSMRLAIPELTSCDASRRIIEDIFLKFLNRFIENNYSIFS
jgi:hypothetical protein